MTSDQPKQVYIYGSVISEPSHLGVCDDLIELKYLIGCHFNLNVRATEINGMTKYYADNIRSKIFGTKDDLVV